MNNFFCGLTALLLVSITLNAQDLATKIPDDAFAVVSFKSGHFFKLVDVSEFNTSAIGERLLNSLNSENAGQLSSIAELGVDIRQSVYYYTRRTDSIWYNTLLIPLQDPDQFERILGEGKEIVHAEGYRRLAVDSAQSRSSLVWNDRMAVICFGSLVDSFFDDEDAAARHGIEQLSYANPYSYSDEWSIEPAEEYADSIGADIDPGISPPVVDSLSGIIDSLYWDADTSYRSEYKWEDYDGKTDSSYWDRYEANQRIKDSLTSEWADSYAEAALFGLPRKNILTNASYAKSLDKDALVTAWLSSFDLLYDDVFSSLLGGMYGKSAAMGFGSMQMGVYANGDEMRLRGKVEVKGDMARSYARIYDSKMNRKFLRYLDSENLIGFVGYAVNTRAYMEEFPKILMNIYGPLAGQYEDEINIGAALFSLLLDEKAIGETVRGDGVFVLNGVSKHEVAYTEYEYDEDYNPIEVQKTKTETVPDFLLMFSSDNPSLYDRLMGYSAKKGVGEFSDGMYTLRYRKLPVSLHVTRRDGIIFLGTSPEQVGAIAVNRYRGKASRFHKKLLVKNLSSGFLSASKAMELIPEEDLQSLEDHLRFRQLFGNVGDFYFSSGKMKANTFSGEFVAKTPKDFKNALHYIMWLVEYAAVGY